MGDPARFRLFAAEAAKLVSPDARIADVAGGKGKLRGSLHQIGYRNVLTVDKRPYLARGRRGEAYRLLDWETEKERFDLILGMHPDQATDHIILFAAKTKTPAIICP